MQHMGRGGTVVLSSGNEHLQSQPAAQPLEMGEMTWKADIKIEEKKQPHRLSEQSEQMQEKKTQPYTSQGLLNYVLCHMKP